MNNRNLVTYRDERQLNVDRLPGVVAVSVRNGGGSTSRLGRDLGANTDSGGPNEPRWRPGSPRGRDNFLQGFLRAQ